MRPSDLAPKGAADDDPRRYTVLEIAVFAPARYCDPGTAVRLHFYDLGPARGFVLVGIERLREAPAS